MRLKKLLKITHYGMFMGPHFRINDETDIYVIEDIIQKYLKENYEMYGFTEISGPFKRGPDFKGKIKNRNVRIEVENTIDDYFKHGHHKDPRFDDVSILIVFINYGVSKDLKRTIFYSQIHLNILFSDCCFF